MLIHKFLQSDFYSFKDLLLADKKDGSRKTKVLKLKKFALHS